MRATASATFTLRSPVLSGFAAPGRLRSLCRLYWRRRQVLRLLETLPLLGGPAVADGLELAQEYAPQEGDAGIGGGEVLLRAVANHSLTPHCDVVLGIEQAEFVHAFDH